MVGFYLGNEIYLDRLSDRDRSGSSVRQRRRSLDIGNQSINLRFTYSFIAKVHSCTLISHIPCETQPQTDIQLNSIYQKPAIISFN